MYIICSVFSSVIHSLTEQTPVYPSSINFSLLFVDISFRFMCMHMLIFGENPMFPTFVTFELFP